MRIKMGNTKEAILMTALRLFAKDGYEAVSVSMIAGALGMTKGALYKHYKNKRDIFDSIVERMYQVDAERAQQYDVPEEAYETAPETYNGISKESIRSFTLAQFTFWTEDEFASNFRRMLALERYRNAEMAKLYDNCLTAGPVSYMKDIFRKMQPEKGISDADAELLAMEFYAPLYLLIQVYDLNGDQERAVKILERHVENFLNEWIR